MLKKSLWMTSILFTLSSCGADSAGVSVRHCQAASPLENVDVSFCLDYEFNPVMASQIGTIETQ